MASHFVRHYASLGIPASNMNFLIDPGPKNTSGPMAADLIEFGVPLGGLRTVRADRRVSGGFHTHKLRAINSALARLPNDSWAVYADVDEFYSYPCDLPEHTTRADIFCGQMTDRIAANGSIVPLLPRVAISEQFPASCNVRRHLRSGEGVNTEKVVLMRTRRRKDGKLRRLVTPHKTNWQYGRQGRCVQLGEFSHYTLTEQQVGATQHKIATWNNAHLRLYYHDLLRFLQQHAPATGRNALLHPYCHSRQVVALRAFRVYGGTELWSAEWSGAPGKWQWLRWRDLLDTNNESLLVMANALKPLDRRRARKGHARG